ncbi:hypothetical protein Tco_1465330 [Tanacetum coccineum]
MLINFYRRGCNTRNSRINSRTVDIAHNGNQVSLEDVDFIKSAMGAMDKALYSFIEETSGKRWNEVEAGLGDAVQGKTSETGCLECLVFGGLLHQYSLSLELRSHVTNLDLPLDFNSGLNEDEVMRHGVHVAIISYHGGKIYFAALVGIEEGIENMTKTCVLIIRVFDVLYLKRCMEGSVGHMFFRLKLEKFGRLDRNWYKRQQIRVEVGDKVMLEVSSWKDVVHFGKKGKLAPRYVGPFEILERIGPVAYRLRLPKELSEVHDTFHVSNLKKCLADANLHVPLEEIKVDKTLHFVEEPVEIIDREVKSLKRSRIPIVKSIGTRSEIIRIS